MLDTQMPINSQRDDEAIHSNKKASELLLESAYPFDAACVKVKKMEDEKGALIAYLKRIGYEGDITGQAIAERITELEARNKELCDVVEQIYCTKDEVRVMLARSPDNLFNHKNVVDELIELEKRLQKIALGGNK